MRLPKVIDHSNMMRIRNRIFEDPYYRPGQQRVDAPAPWTQQHVTLEVPIGELAEDPLKTIALVGRDRLYTVAELTGKEGFTAQGLEGKACIRKPLVTALLNLDLVPKHRGRVVTR